eukprot:6448066-Amphidinium_carterae.1
MYAYRPIGCDDWTDPGLYAHCTPAPIGHVSETMLSHLLEWPNAAIYMTDVASAFFNTPLDEEVLVQPPKEYYHNRPNILWSLRKTLHGTMLKCSQGGNMRMMCPSKM